MNARKASMRRKGATAAVKTGAKREAARQAGKKTTPRGKKSERLREEVLELRETVLRSQEEAARIKAELSARTEERLREANERLVVATVSAHVMAEAAEQATAQMSHMAEHDFLTG